jgi:hypothetical protein
VFASAEPPDPRRVVAFGDKRAVERIMSSENLHAPRERLSQQTLNLHFAIVSLMEELDAIDWYRQRADDAEDETLKELLLHNMREEMEHASMLLEWIRRRDTDFERFLKTYLFTEGSILQEEKAATAQGVGKSGSETSRRGPDLGFTIGSLRDE